MSRSFVEEIKLIPYVLLGKLNAVLFRLIYTFSWSTLRDIEHNKVVKSTYVWLFVVPISAKAFSKLENELSFSFNGQLVTLDLTLPFAWQALFFSASFFVLANLLVTFLMPETVKNYKDFSDYSGSGKTADHLEELRKNLEDISGKEVSRLKKLAGIQDREKTENDFKNQFSEVYLRISYGNPWLRALCSLLYIFGFLFIVDIAHQNFMWVVEFTDLKSFKDQLFFSPAIDWLVNII